MFKIHESLVFKVNRMAAVFKLFLLPRPALKHILIPVVNTAEKTG